MEESTAMIPTDSQAQGSEAVAEVLGALAYALLRVFRLSAQATSAAPTLGLAEIQGRFAVDEFERFGVMRRRIEGLGADPEESMLRYREPLDVFYDAAPVDDWLSIQVFQVLGNAIAADFAGLVAGVLDPASAEAVREALGERGPHAAFSLEEIRREVEGDPDARIRAVRVAGAIVGGGLGTLRTSLERSDSLAVVLGGRDRVKETAMALLAAHRERLERLGLESVD